MSRRKPKAKKLCGDFSWTDRKDWTVSSGKLKPGPGRPGRVRPLFKAVAEKIPFVALNKIAAHLKKTGIPRTGVYIAHDSMGVARYIGRGGIFHRLKIRLNAQPLELVYFSFYVVADSTHER